MLIQWGSRVEPQAQVQDQIDTADVVEWSGKNIVSTLATFNIISSNYVSVSLTYEHYCDTVLRAAKRGQ